MMNSKELEQLILQHRRALELFASQWSSSPEDCVQEAFLKLFRNPTSVQNAKAWLFRVVRNLAIDSLRSDQSRRTREQGAAEHRDWFESDASDQLDAVELQAALQELPNEIREVVIARIWGDLTLEEISESFDIAISTVHRRYHSGIEKLQSIFHVSPRSSIHE